MNLCSNGSHWQCGVSIEPRLFSHGNLRMDLASMRVQELVSIEPRLFSHGNIPSML
jgi:hypothetical protein